MAISTKELGFAAPEAAAQQGQPELPEEVVSRDEIVGGLRRRIASLEAHRAEPTSAEIVAQLQGQLRAAEEQIAMHRDEIIKVVNACKTYEQIHANQNQQIQQLIRRELNYGMAGQALAYASQALGADKRLANFAEFANYCLEFLRKSLPPEPHPPGNSADPDVTAAMSVKRTPTAH